MKHSFSPSEYDFDPKTEDFFVSEVTKERKYLHFDIKLKDSERLLSVDFSKEERKHRFYPLLGYEQITRKFGKDGKAKKKERSIRYASHKDAAYLEAYSIFLSRKYETILNKFGIEDCVLAYRKGGGSNIDHAKKFFELISSFKDCYAIALDISGFFDNINHGLLYKEICNVLGVDKLEGHHITIWKAITKYSWVNIKDLESIIGKKNLYKNGRICHISKIRRRGIINKNRDGNGIPQGTPVSGLYANISLLSFDKDVRDYCNRMGGVYMRYSDDIGLIVPCNINPDDVVKYIEKALKRASLDISRHKTEISRFKKGKVAGCRPFQYLGFVYDGEKILIRSSTISTYLRKMRRGIRVWSQ